MTASTIPEVQFTPYGPDRFPDHVPVARRGYLFTVPGAFPADIPGHTRVVNSVMAVYRHRGAWQVRDADGHREVKGEGPTRRAAVAVALETIAAERRERAEYIRASRVDVCGLEPVPPYVVETTAHVTLLMTPELIAVLRRTEHGEPALYHATDLATGKPVTVPADGRVRVGTRQVGILHTRCCDPKDGYPDHFETEDDALECLATMTVWWHCTKRTA